VTTLRLIPVLLLAASALLALKLSGLMLEGGPVAPSGVGVGTAMAQTQEPPASDAADSGDVPADAEPQADPSLAPPPDGGPMPTPADAADAGLPAGLELGGSIAERKVLESLSGRRRELDKREKQFELRQQLLQATEERLQKKVEEMKALEASISTLRQEQEDKKKDDLRNLIQMYESMKAKDAARIFDRLDIDILLKVAKQMKPRKMADIMGRMSPEASERLTVALVTGRKDEEAAAPPVSTELPKIMGN
jgi:flagellar motility protein MotE (MotC chaperone)